jgi:hypothetical protein
MDKAPGCRECHQETESHYYAQNRNKGSYIRHTIAPHQAKAVQSCCLACNNQAFRMIKMSCQTCERQPVKQSTQEK